MAIDRSDSTGHTGRFEEARSTAPAECGSKPQFLWEEKSSLVMVPSRRLRHERARVLDGADQLRGRIEFTRAVEEVDEVSCLRTFEAVRRR